jgi:hypothetical protein
MRLAWQERAPGALARCVGGSAAGHRRHIAAAATGLR